MLFFLSLIEDQNDAAFIEGLYLAHYRMMYAQALRVLRHPEDAEDAVSQAMVKLIKKIHILRGLPGNKQEAYLVISVRNTAINLFNQRKTQAERRDGRPLEGLAQRQELGPEARVQDMDGVERVKDAIRSLPARERDALMMRYFQQMTDGQIAQEMGIAHVSARALISRGRKRLQGILQERRG